MAPFTKPWTHAIPPGSKDLAETLNLPQTEALTKPWTYGAPPDSSALQSLRLANEASRSDLLRLSDAVLDHSSAFVPDHRSLVRPSEQSGNFPSASSSTNSTSTGEDEVIWINVSTTDTPEWTQLTFHGGQRNTSVTGSWAPDANAALSTRDLHPHPHKHPSTSSFNTSTISNATATITQPTHGHSNQAYVLVGMVIGVTIFGVVIGVTMACGAWGGEARDKVKMKAKVKQVKRVKRVKEGRGEVMEMPPAYTA